MIRMKCTLQRGIPAVTIWLTGRLKTLDGEAIPYVIVHQSSHYCGPVEGQPNEIHDRHGYRLSPNYDRLTPEQALETGDCYSQYAFHAAVGVYSRSARAQVMNVALVFASGGAPCAPAGRQTLQAQSR